ncbi:HAD family hydrolase [Paenibacillus sp. DMB20]|uniref:HAD family hydrolase n=1 Tax=Paenibacillus sp. DMB20 TaxID=1642570 RepID=UPI000627CD3A|nr:HAD family hydrolase [Paenibacillus sp. DMB20]KKO51096.1 hypothetical protein XI25_29330 [Paenibacillus sp. DMB20]
MYDCIIFDVDGTLIDTEAAVLGSLKKFLAEKGCTVPVDENLRFALGIPGKDALLKLGIQDTEEGCRIWNEYMKEFMDDVHPFQGTREVLAELKSKGIRTGIVTSKTRQELQDDFVPFGLMDQLDVVVCADDTEKHKPCPEPLLKFLEISGADPARSIYIGDTMYDAECASDAHVDFGLALWGAPSPDQVKIAAHRLKHPSDITSLV